MHRGTHRLMRQQLFERVIESFFRKQVTGKLRLTEERPSLVQVTGKLRLTEERLSLVSFESHALTAVRALPRIIVPAWNSNAGTRGAAHPATWFVRERFTEGGQDARS
jgi:hypothetical protein